MLQTVYLILNPNLSHPFYKNAIRVIFVFRLDDEEIKVSPQSYIDLLDNKIDGTGNSEWTLERRIGTRPVHKSKLERPVYRQNDDNWYQVYIDVYKNESDKVVEIFTTNVYRQF